MSFDGTLAGDNKEIRELNEKILELKSILLDRENMGLSVDKYILDFENFEIEVLFSANRKRAKISIEDEVISVQIGDSTIRIGADGTLIQ